MSFLETLFANAASGELPEESAAADEVAAYEVPPGELGMPLYRPKSSLITARSSARSNERRFPREFEQKIDAGNLSKGIGHTLVRTLGPMSFILQKHRTGRQFSVRVGAERSCTCPECEVAEGAKVDVSSRRVCAATLYILLKVLQIPKESPLIFKKNWNATEIRRVLQARADQREMILDQNHFLRYTAETEHLHPELAYDDEYDRTYGYDDGFNEVRAS